LGLVAELLQKEVVRSEPLGGVTAGSAVAAVASDEVLYRGTVITANEGETAMIKFVDYGFTEEVPLTSIFTLPTSLTTVPVLALPICLSDTPDEPFSEEALTVTAEILAENTAINVTPVSWKGEVCVAMVTLEGGVDVRKRIPGFGGAEEEEKPVASGVRVASSRLEEGAQSLYVSVAVNPTEIYVQKEEWTQDLEEISTQLESEDSATPLTSSPAPGDFCIALSAEFEAKYRAQVISISPDGTILVRYCDYGNSESLPLANLSVLPESLAVKPALAVPCCLSEQKEWSPSKDGVLAGLAEQEVTVTPVEWKDDVCVCQITFEGANLVDKLMGM